MLVPLCVTVTNTITEKVTKVAPSRHVKASPKKPGRGCRLVRQLPKEIRLWPVGLKPRRLAGRHPPAEQGCKGRNAYSSKIASPERQIGDLFPLEVAFGKQDCWRRSPDHRHIAHLYRKGRISPGQKTVSKTTTKAARISCGAFLWHPSSSS